jgi:hypothetical protein
MLDGAALEQRREILHRELLDQPRLRPERLEVERADTGPDLRSMTGSRSRSGLRGVMLRQRSTRQPAEPGQGRALRFDPAGPCGLVGTKFGHFQHTP